MTALEGKASGGGVKITELKHSIFQFAGKKPSCHSYLIKGTRKNLLIDTGLPQAMDYLLDCLQEVGLSARDIHLVVLTHEHMDHIGGVPLFSDTAVVAAHALAANKIALQDEFVMLNRAFLADRPNAFDVDWCLEGEATIELGNYSLRILHTPGHSSGCICLHEPDHGLLFTGDTVTAGGGMAGIFGSGNISDYIKTLNKLRSLRIKEFYPGHGWISQDAEGDIKKASEKAVQLLSDSKLLFEALGRREEHFDHIFTSAKGLNRQE